MIKNLIILIVGMYLVYILASFAYNFAVSQSQPERNVLLGIDYTTRTPPTPTPFGGNNVSDPNQLNPSITITAIEDAVKKKNYASLDKYMESHVAIFYLDTDCCGTLSKMQAIRQLAFLDGAVEPWDFSNNNPVTDQFRQILPDYFRNAFIGVSVNRFVASFDLSSSHRIERIVLVSDYKNSKTLNVPTPAIR